MIPKPEDKFYNQLTFQNAYNKKFHVLARDLVKSYMFLNKDKSFFKEEVLEYQHQVMETGKDAVNYTRERFGASKQYYIDRGKSANLISFWLRRGIDGTNEIIWDGLVKIMNMYDKEWFDKQNVQIPK